MKKSIKVNMLLMVAIFVLLCGCSNDDDKPQGEKNYLGGYGEFRQEYGKTYGLPAFYDDEYIYVQANDMLAAFNMEDGSYRPVCVDASCEHDEINCKQNIGLNMREYFVFNNKLYYSIANKNIYDAATETVIYTITVPKELLEEEDGDKYKTFIYVAAPINENYLQVNCLQYVYILDKEFNEVYWHKRGEAWHFSMIDENTYYYTSDFRIVKTDLTTGEETILTTEGPIVDVDMNSKGLYYTNTYNELFKYDLNTQESTFIADNIAFICCSEEHIYYIERNMNETDENQNNQIKAIDEKGQLVYSISNPLDAFVTSEMYIIDGKIYAYDTYSESLLICNLDGTKQIVSKVK